MYEARLFIFTHLQVGSGTGSLPKPENMDGFGLLFNNQHGEEGEKKRKKKKGKKGGKKNGPPPNVILLWLWQ